MRILISDNVQAHKTMVYPLPWDSMALCYNFKAPTETVLPESISKIDFEKIKTLVVDTPLSDYSFIKKAHNLEQLYIFEGANVTNLDFISGSLLLSQLVIRNACFETLDGLVELTNNKYEAYCPYKNLSGREECDARLKYDIDGIFLQSEKYKGSGNEILHEVICRFNIRINGKRVGAY